MRYAGLPLIFASLIAGMLAGLWRAGFSGIDLGAVGNVHGSLMTGSFLGSLIALERAVAVRRWYAYLVPLLGGLSMPLFFAAPTLAFLLLCTASAGLVALTAWLYHRYNEWHYLVFIAGAACWLIGNTVILTGDYYFFAAPWWMVFFLLTIVAERMELARFVLLHRSRTVLLTALLALAFLSLLLPFHSWGKTLLGVSFALTAMALMRYDIARRNARFRGIHRYSGYALLTGYGWLWLAGVGMAFLPYTGLLYDALLHAYFIGFVFSMIFAHGPVILPSVLRLGTYVFHPALWFWLAALNLSLALRLAADLLGSAQFRLVGSWGNALAILGFLLTVAVLVVRGKGGSVHPSTDPPSGRAQDDSAVM